MAVVPTTVPRMDFGAVKAAIHRKLIQKLNLERMTEVNRDEVRREVGQILEGLVVGESTPMNLQERERLAQEVLDEVFGLGPLEPLLADPTVSDILVNTHRSVYVERKGILEQTSVQFRDDAHLIGIIDRIVSAIGRRVDESSPMVDARLADGSRVNAIIPPLAVDGPCLSIRRFGRDRLTADDLLRNNSLTAPMLDLLKGCVKARLNILISGGTGAGKTTFLNVLSSYISNRERIVTIEDAAELQLHQEHVVRLETRPPNIEGKGAIHQRQLVINSLRMRPDRIIVGEVRSEEALDMLQAMNTGHDGSLTTVHANTPRDALGRLETMVAMANLNLPESAIRRQICSAIDLVVQVSRMSDGTRKLVSVAEITGMEGEIVTMQDIFIFRKRGIRESGEVLGEFVATGIRPKFSERLLVAGVQLPISMFEVH
ncbi:MAG: pilus assembly protein CpaF [Acidobacteria bacterium]|nr:MAG: pilus assembly protein CpaF [Acidobacteria bacterium 13_1_40CM_4_58_4]PYT63206.1 MAG: pilus assembly protein CpaF [Acidobacteriota bacterium]